MERVTDSDPETLPEHRWVATARSIRGVLVEHARSRRRSGAGVLAIDTALTALERTCPRLAQVVELRVFARLSTRDTARCLGVTHREARRMWQAARGRLTELLA